MKSKNSKKVTSKKLSYPLSILVLTVASTALAAVVTHEAKKAPENIPSDNPVTVDNFTINGVEASNSNDKLVWSRCLVGQTFENNTCTGKPTEFTTWEDALNAPTAAQAAEGWRVPNIKELMRITDNTYVYPATNTEVFAFAKVLKFAEDDGYQATPHSPSSPYIWSSTPVAHKLATKDPDSFSDLSATESAERSDMQRQEAMKTYALNLQYGDTTKVYRDGSSIGEKESTQYSKPDPDNVKKARYVLLVKNA